MGGTHLVEAYGVVDDDDDDEDDDFTTHSRRGLRVATVRQCQAPATAWLRRGAPPLCERAGQ